MAMQITVLCYVLLFTSVLGGIIDDIVHDAQAKKQTSKPMKRFCYHTDLFKTAYEQLLHDRKELHGGLCISQVVSDVDTNYYYFSKPDEVANWFGAEDFCKAHGMTLARVDTIPDHLALLAAAEKQLTGPADFFWIGLNDQAEEGIFEWSYLQGNKTSHAWLWAFGWHDGDPTSNCYNTDGNDLDCVVIAPREDVVKWEDKDCEASGRFICRLNPVYRDMMNFRCHSKRH